MSIDIDELLPYRLPTSVEVIREGKEMAKDVEIQRTLFMQHYGVDSEFEYKQRMIKEHKVMYNMQIGFPTVDATCKAIKFVYESVVEQGGQIDRAVLLQDRRMGLPAELRHRYPYETGFMVNNPDEWLKFGQTVPIHTSIQDHCIGSPAAVSQVKSGLRAGFTTLGNLSQYFTYDYPGWTDIEARAIETVKSIAIMAELKSKGVMVQSNVSDGYGAIFDDLASVFGWAILEKHIVEDLVGARMTHAYGNQFVDPIERLAFLQALNELYEGKLIGTQITGNTMMSENIYRNYGTLSTYLLFDIIGQLETPTGHAVTPIPVTEALRIPSPDEIVQCFLLTSQMEKEAHRLQDALDWEKVRMIKQKIVEGGTIFYEKLRTGLSDMGVHTDDPIELLVVLKRLPPERMIEAFRIGERDDSYPLGTHPLIPSSIAKSMMMTKRRLLETVVPTTDERLTRLTALLVSTDVHRFGAYVVKAAISKFGIGVLDLGVNADTHRVAETASKSKADLIVVSTHNGMALDYGKNLLEDLSRFNVRVPVFMGGRLNQKEEGNALPKDVTSDLDKIGVIVCASVEEIIPKIAQIFKRRSLAMTGESLAK